VQVGLPAHHDFQSPPHLTPPCCLVGAPSGLVSARANPQIWSPHERGRALGTLIIPALLHQAPSPSPRTPSAIVYMMTLPADDSRLL
jgi:hypothetical protein